MVVLTVDGGTLSCAPTTNSNRHTTCRYRVNAKSGGKGSYEIVASATKSGHVSGSGTSGFIVE